MMIPLIQKLTLRPESRRCHHTNADGSGCKANPQRGREYCFFHDPDQQEKRRAANQTGGAHSRRRKRKRDFNPLETPSQVGQFLRELMNDVRDGEVGVRRCNALARVAPLVLGIIDRETAKIEQEKHEALAAAEAEQRALKQQALAEHVAKRLREVGAVGAGESFTPAHMIPAPADCSHSRSGANGSRQAGRDAFIPNRAAPALDAGRGADAFSSPQGASELETEPAECHAAPRTEPETTTPIPPHHHDDDDSVTTMTGDDMSDEEDESGPSDEREYAASDRPRRYESKDVFIGQTFPVDMARRKLDAQNEVVQKAARAARPGDMARRKLDEQTLAFQKEMACGLAPRNMRSPMFEEEGAGGAKPPGPWQTAQRVELEVNATGRPG